MVDELILNQKKIIFILKIPLQTVIIIDGDGWEESLLLAINIHNQHDTVLLAHTQYISSSWPRHLESAIDQRRPHKQQ